MFNTVCDRTGILFLFNNLINLWSFTRPPSTASYLQRVHKRILLILNGSEQPLFLLPVSDVGAGSADKHLEVGCGRPWLHLLLPVDQLYRRDGISFWSKDSLLWQINWLIFHRSLWGHPWSINKYIFLFREKRTFSAVKEGQESAKSVEFVPLRLGNSNTWSGLVRIGTELHGHRRVAPRRHPL